MLTDSDDNFTDSIGGSDPDFKNTPYSWNSSYECNGEADSTKLKISSSHDDRWDDLCEGNGGTPLSMVSGHILQSNIGDNI